MRQRRPSEREKGFRGAEHGTCTLLTMVALATSPWGCTVRSGAPTRDAGPGDDAGRSSADAPFSFPDSPWPDSGPPRDTGGFCGGDLIPLTRLPARLVFVVDRSSSTLGPSDPTLMPTSTDLGSCAMTNARPLRAGAADPRRGAIAP